MNTFRQDLEAAIARHSKGHSCDTADYVLAQFLTDCLAAYDRARQGKAAQNGKANDKKREAAHRIDAA